MGTQFKIFRTELARWLMLLSIAGLAHCAVMLVSVWGMAFHDDMIPNLSVAHRGNHGPWNHYSGQIFVWEAITAPFFGGVLAFASFMVCPRRSSGALFFVCLATLWIVTKSHFWLVD